MFHSLEYVLIKHQLKLSISLMTPHLPTQTILIHQSLLVKIFSVNNTGRDHFPAFGYWKTNLEPGVNTAQ